MNHLKKSALAVLTAASGLSASSIRSTFLDTPITGFASPGNPITQNVNVDNDLFVDLFITAGFNSFNEPFVVVSAPTSSTRFRGTTPGNNSADFIATALNGGEIIDNTSMLTGTGFLDPANFTGIKNEFGSFVFPYLGIEFQIGDSTHYGWAAVTASTSAESASFELTSYGYNCTAGESIAAGATSNDSPDTCPAIDVNNVPEPSTLMLAVLGIAGIAALRKRKSK